MRIQRFGNLLTSLKKSNLAAKDGKTKGSYPFFTSSQVVSSFVDIHQYDGECLIIGTGGSPSIHYFKGRFAVSSHCSVFKANDRELFNLKYVFYYLSKNMHLLELGFKGAGLKNISNSFINGINIPLPTFSQQNQIVQVFDKAYNILEIRSKAIDAISRFIVEDLFANLFGDVYTNSMNWPTIELEKLCERIVDCPHSTPEYADFETEYPCFRSSDIQNGFIDLKATKFVGLTEYINRTQRYEPNIGDVIYCREGARFGIAAIIQNHKTACLGQRMMLFTPHKEKSNKWFVVALLNSNGLYHKAKEKSGGAGSPHVNVGEIKRFQVINPPKSEQDKFSAMANIADSSRNKMISQRVVLKEFIESLADNAFNKGELETNVTAFSFDDQLVSFIEAKDEVAKQVKRNEKAHEILRQKLTREFLNGSFTFKDIEKLSESKKLMLQYDGDESFSIKGIKDIVFELLDSDLDNVKPFLEQIFLEDKQVDALRQKDNSRIAFKINN